MPLLLKDIVGINFLLQLSFGENRVKLDIE